MSAKPEWAGEHGTSYEQIVGSWGYDVLEFETFGSYQGDHLALLRRGEEVGLIVFGYGSCSGCDELESIAPSWWDDDDPGDWRPVIDLSDRLRKSVHWSPSRDDLREWIDATPENHWWSYEDEIARWLNANLATSLRVEDDES